MLIWARLTEACARCRQCLSLEKGRAEVKGSDTGLRWRARLDVAWAREPWGTRVRAGMAREPLLLEGLEVRVVDDGFSEGRHLCKRHIVCSWGYKSAWVWAAGRRGKVVLGGMAEGRSACSLADYRSLSGP